MADGSWRIIPPNVSQDAGPVNFPAIDAARGPGGAARMIEGRNALGGQYGFRDEVLGPIADNLQAGIGATMDYARGGGKVRWGDLYDEYMSIVKPEQRAYREDFGKEALAANLVGGLALGGPKSAVQGAQSIWQTARQSAKVAAPIGAVIGAAEADEGGISSRLVGAGTGAAVAAGLGFGMPILINAGQRLVGALGRLKGLKGETATRRAEEMIARALQRDGIDPATLRSSGKPMTFADLGPNTRALVGAAHRQGGDGKKIIEEFLEGRSTGQYGRLTGDMASRSGANPREFAETGASIAQSRALEASAGYPAAYRNAPPVLSANANTILNTPTGKSAVNRALKVMADKRAPVRGADGNYTVQMLDQIQRQLRDTASSAGRAGRGEFAGSVKTLRDEFLAELPDDLRGVMANYRSQSELLDALKAGREFLRGDADAVATSIANMSPQQVEMYRLGAARELQAKMAAKGDGADASLVFSNPQVRERVSAIFPSKRLFQDFMDSVADEKTMQATRNAILKGSQTSERGIANDEFATEVLGEFANDMATGGNVGVGVVRASKNAAMRGAERYLQGINEAVAREVGRFAVDPNMGGLAQRLAPQGTAVAPYRLPNAALPVSRAGAAAGASMFTQQSAAPVIASGWQVLPPE